MSEERNTSATTGGKAKKLIAGAVAVGALALFGGAAYAQQQDGPQQDPARQTPNTQQEEQQRGSGDPCPWEEQQQEGVQQTEV